MEEITDARDVGELDRADEPAGSKGVSLGVAGLTVTFFVLLPAVVAVAIYTFVTVYAIVKGVSGGSDTPDPITILVGIVLLVTLFTVLVAVGVMLLGRMADPKKRR